MAAAATVALHLIAARWVTQQLAVEGEGTRVQAISAELRVVDPATAPAPAPKPAPAPERVRSAAPAAQAVELAVEQAEGVPLALPPPAQLVYDTSAGGEALMEWMPDGSRYRLRVLHSGASIESEGALGAAGIAPQTVREQRRGRSLTATHFDAAGGRITFSASQAVAALAAGAQDRASFLMQLVAIARADPARLASGIGLLVAGERGAQEFRFTLAGEEVIDTPLGSIAAWRLVRQTPPGTWHARLDIWLAPGHQWYPVQLRTTEANGVVTTQTIRQIVIKEN